MNKTAGLKFSDLKEPRVLCLIFVNGGGTKIFHSYLDGHPEFYNIPAFPLLYFYAHWERWQQEYQEVWDWDTIINIFCIKHASVINSSKIPGLNGLDGLGEGKDENIAIDAEEFRGYLKSLLCEEPVSRRTFLLAVNYAYALCKKEDISIKKFFLWHHHNIHQISYLQDFLSDFPDACIIGTIRDPRIKIYGSCAQEIKTDLIKLNVTDAMINRSYVFYQNNRMMFMFPYELFKLDVPGGIFFLKHEDLASDLPRVMRRTAELVNARFLDSMLESTFDGKAWWGHDIYSMPVSNAASTQEQVKQISQEALKRVLSKEWQKQKPSWEIFILEALEYDFLIRYGYDPLYYKKDAWWEKLLFAVAVWVPFTIEIQDTFFYLNPATHVKLVQTAWKEAVGEIKRKYYGFNGAYLFKHNYKAFAYWRQPLISRWLDHAEKFKDRSALEHRIFMAACCGYVAYIYTRFLAAIVFLPFQYCRRVAMYYFIFFRRLFHGNFLARQL